MKLLIISDIHDNLANLKKCLDWARGQSINQVICAGDLTNSETLALLSKSFKTIYLVRGNVELYDEEEIKQYDNIKFLGSFGTIDINGQIIGLCHEPWNIKRVVEAKQCKIVFYGHTHKPWIEEKDGVTIANPGTLGGVFTKATFAVWDSQGGELELKVLELI